MSGPESGQEIGYGNRVNGHALRIAVGNSRTAQVSIADAEFGKVGVFNGCLGEIDTLEFGSSKADIHEC